MFRKIHSNRPPGTTLGGELQKEFGRYLKRGSYYVQRLLKKYPVAFLSGMATCILLSGVLAFTVMRIKKPDPLPGFPKAATKGPDGLSGVLDTYQALKEAASLQSRIEAIARQGSLSEADSAEVWQALKRIEQLQHQHHLHLTPKP